MSLLNNRKEAKLSGARHYFTGKPCKYGHVSIRWTSDGQCRGCKNPKCRIRGAIVYKADPVRENARAKEWIKRNYARWQELRRADYLKNKGKIIARMRAWKLKNRERTNEWAREWKKLNREAVNARTAARRAKKISATPNWLTKAHRKSITSFYKRAMELSMQLGIPHEVDHIVPLRGKTVCGLHVPWNLQVIPATENNKKGARY